MSDRLQLHLADCLEVMRDMADGSVNLIVTDPPYFKVKGEPWDRQWKDADRFLAWLGEIADEWRRILAPNGSLYCFASSKLQARVELLLGERFNVQANIVWAKPKFSTKAEMFDKDTMRNYFPVTERVIFAEQYGTDSMSMGESGYEAQCEKLRGETFDPLRLYICGEFERAGMLNTAGKIAANVACGFSATPGGMAARHYFSRSQWWLPTAEHYAKLREMLNTKQGAPFLTREYEELRAEYEELRARFKELRAEYEELRRPFNVSAEVPYTDVWTYPTVSRYPGKHPCEKPYDMARDIVRASSRPGDLVFDPFMGSGVFGKAALNEGRRFIGCDMTEKYFNRARAELEKL